MFPSSWLFTVMSCVLCCRDEASLLVRTAHACDLHPVHRNAILIFGGYGGAGEVYDFLDDILLLHTDRWRRAADLPVAHQMHRLCYAGHQ